VSVACCLKLWSDGMAWPGMAKQGMACCTPPMLQAPSSRRPSSSTERRCQCSRSTMTQVRSSCLLASSASQRVPAATGARRGCHGAPAPRPPGCLLGLWCASLSPRRRAGTPPILGPGKTQLLPWLHVRSLRLCLDSCGAWLDLRHSAPQRSPEWGAALHAHGAVHDFGFMRFDPGRLEFMELGEVPLAPEAATVGMDIRVVGNDSGEKVRPGPALS
jgi:hypothetical protein